MSPTKPFIRNKKFSWPTWRLTASNCLLVGNQLTAVLEVATINLANLTAEDVSGHLSRFENFLNSQKQAFQVLIQSRPLQPNNYLENLKKSLKPNQLGKNFEDYRQLVSDLATQNQIIDRRFYLLVSCRFSQEAKSELAWQLTQVQNNLRQAGFFSQALKRAAIVNLLKTSGIGSRLVEEPGQVVAGRQFFKTLAIKTWPLMIHQGLLEKLVNWPKSVDISFHYQPVETGLALACLGRKISESESRRRSQLKRGQLLEPQLLDPLDSAQDLQKQIQRGQQKLFLLGIYINLRAKSQEEIEQLNWQLENLLAGQLFALDRLEYEQLPALASVWPSGQNYLGRWRNLDSSCAGLTWPFLGAQLSDKKGSLLGVNLNNNSLVLLDRFSLNNANSLIFAQSGAGKSYAAKVEILRQHLLGASIVVIDPEGEYSALAEHLAGQVLRLDPNSFGQLNLLDRQLWLAETAESNQLDDLVSVLELFLAGLDLADRLSLEAVIKEIYKAGQQPTVDDLIDRVSLLKPLLGQRIESLAKTSLAALFSSQKSLNLTASLTVFNLSNWPARLRPGLTLFLAHLVRRQGGQKRLLVIDEAWQLLADQRTGSFLADLVRRARKDYLGVCLISQNASDFLNNPAGQAIALQAAHKLILKIEASAVRQVRRQFNLSQVEADFLLTAAAGWGLLLTPNQRLMVKIVASKTEDKLINTNPAKREGEVSD